MSALMRLTPFLIILQLASHPVSNHPCCNNATNLARICTEFRHNLRFTTFTLTIVVKRLTRRVYDVPTELQSCRRVESDVPQEGLYLYTENHLACVIYQNHSSREAFPAPASHQLINFDCMLYYQLPR